MDDFLSTLVSRTMGLHQSLQPRRASRFEPESFAGAGDSSFDVQGGIDPHMVSREDTHEQAPRTTRGDDDPPRRLNSDPRHTYPADQVDASSESVEVNGVIGGDELVVPVGFEMQPDEHAPEQRVSAQRVEHTVAAPTDVTDAGELGAEKGTSPGMQNHPKKDRATFRPEARRTSGEPKEDTERISSIVPQPSIEPPHGVSDSEQRTDLPSPRLATRIASPDEPDSQAKVSGEPGQAPRITVSIGRIEVKNAEGPRRMNPPVAKTRYESRLTLGEYLERSRGVRR